MSLVLKNYVDRKCCYGYMTLCPECRPSAPHWVETNQPINQVLPADRCEMCKRKGVVSVEG
jgi:hypothetical protein